MKLVAQRDDELYEGFGDHCKGFLGCGGFSISDARGHSGIQWENGSTLVQMQPDQRSGDPRPGLFEGVFPLSDFEGNVFGVSMGLKRSSFGDAFRGASRNRMNLVDGRDAFYLPIVVQLMHILFCCGEENVLQYQPSAPNRRNKVPLHIRVPQDGIDAFTSGNRVIIQGEGVNYRMDRGYKQLRGANQRGLCHHENAAEKPQERLLLNDCLGVAAVHDGYYNSRMVRPPSLLSKCSYPAEAQEFIHEIVKDQYGCRFLQETIEEGISQDMQIIFNEIIGHAVGLMVILFGNDLMQKILEVKTHILLRVTRSQRNLLESI